MTIDGGARRWQEEVARDPGSPAFVPLADLYRAQGRIEVARRVCLRGLERDPHNVEAHYLLGRINRDAGDVEAAFDEWDIAIGLDPLHTPSRRALGFFCLERGRLEEASRHLRKASQGDPDDPRVQRALRFLEQGGRRRERDAAFWNAAAVHLHPRIEWFARESRVRLVLLLDGAGRLVAQHGFAPGIDLASLASLAAGIQSASWAMARMIGEEGHFSQLFQGKGERQIFLGATDTPAGELLVLSVFGEDTTIGLVRAVFRDLAERIATVPWPPAQEASPSAPPEPLEAALQAGLERVAVGAGLQRPGAG